MGINDELSLNSALIDLKIIITDLWKEENLVNLLLPLSIRVKFEHKNLYDLDKIRPEIMAIYPLEFQRQSEAAGYTLSWEPEVLLKEYWWRLLCAA